MKPSLAWRNEFIQTGAQYDSHGSLRKQLRDRDQTRIRPHHPKMNPRTSQQPGTCSHSQYLGFRIPNQTGTPSPFSSHSLRPRLPHLDTYKPPSNSSQGSCHSASNAHSNQCLMTAHNKLLLLPPLKHRSQSLIKPFHIRGWCFDLCSRPKVSQISRSTPRNSRST